MPPTLGTWSVHRRRVAAGVSNQAGESPIRASAERNT
ncbi:hypothetical protein CcI6DRAFT_04422, partial [Frankia sp. CcI6]